MRGRGVGREGERERYGENILIREFWVGKFNGDDFVFGLSRSTGNNDVVCLF